MEDMTLYYPEQDPDDSDYDSQSAPVNLTLEHLKVHRGVNLTEDALQGVTESYEQYFNSSRSAEDTASHVRSYNGFVRRTSAQLAWQRPDGSHFLPEATDQEHLQQPAKLTRVERRGIGSSVENGIRCTVVDQRSRRAARIVIDPVTNQRAVYVPGEGLVTDFVDRITSISDSFIVTQTNGGLTAYGDLDRPLANGDSNPSVTEIFRKNQRIVNPVWFAKHGVDKTKKIRSYVSGFPETNRGNLVGVFVRDYDGQSVQNFEPVELETTSGIDLFSRSGASSNTYDHPHIAAATEVYDRAIQKLLDYAARKDSQLYGELAKATDLTQGFEFDDGYDAQTIPVPPIVDAQGRIKGLSLTFTTTGRTILAMDELDAAGGIIPDLGFALVTGADRQTLPWVANPELDTALDDEAVPEQIDAMDTELTNYMSALERRNEGLGTLPSGASFTEIGQYAIDHPAQAETKRHKSLAKRKYELRTSNQIWLGHD